MSNLKEDNLQQVSGGAGQEEFHGYKVTEQCIACGACLHACPVEAISIDGVQATINQSECVQCGSCADECPTEAIRLY